ncbi:hypothetical protein [Phenylobacterium sp.]|uniref:hypothetical protein n=1 Tax=Phenylobacterium sp. TaxID=1871053 RepID=UPI0035C7B797
MNEQLRLMRDRERRRTTAMLALRQEIDQLELDGTQAQTDAALSDLRRWFDETVAPHLDPASASALMVAAEAAVRERAAGRVEAPPAKGEMN